MKKTIKILLKIPLILLVTASLIASIYASYKNIGGVGYGTSAIIGIILVMYLIAEFSKNEKNKEAEIHRG